MVLPSKEVIEQLWSFVKHYRYKNRSRCLIKYNILYSITLILTTLYTLMLISLAYFTHPSWRQNFFKKVGKTVYPHQRIGIVYISKFGRRSRQQPRVWPKRAWSYYFGSTPGYGLGLDRLRISEVGWPRWKNFSSKAKLYNRDIRMLLFK